MPHPVFELRPVIASDAEVIAGLHTESWRDAYRGILTDAYLDGDILPERQAHWRARLERPTPGQFGFLALREATPVGFAFAFPHADQRWGTGPSKSRLRRLEVDPQQAEDDCLAGPPRLPDGGGDERRPREPQERDGQVAERGHHLGPRPPADLGAIFIEGDVPHPVEAVLDRPVGADEREEPGRRGLGRGEAGHPVHGLAVRRARRALGDGAMQTEDLADVGKGEVGVEGRATPEVADLQPTVALLRRRGRRGEKRPAEGWQCRRGAWAGSP